MKIRLLVMILGLALVYANTVYAEEAVNNESEVAVEEAAVLETAPNVSAQTDVAEVMSVGDAQEKTLGKAKLIPLARKSGNEAEIEVEVEALSAVDQMSVYVKELDLTSQQIDLAKYISDDSRIKQEQLLKSVYLLKEQAKTLEEKSLQDFRAILTPEQRKKFDQLRTWYERKYYFENN